MKNLIFVSVFFVILWGCKEKKTAIFPASLNANFTVVIEKYGYVYVLNNSEKAVIYYLNFGDSNESIGDSIKNISNKSSHRYEENGEYTITFTIFDATGNKAILAKKIRITDIPPFVKADFDYEILEDGKVKFVDKSVNSDGKVFWETTNNPYTNSQDINPLFIFEKNGEYSVSLSVANKVVTGTKGSGDVKRVNIKISNAKGYEPPSEFKGLFLNQNWNITLPNINTFDATWGLVALSGFSCNSFSSSNFGNIFIINAGTRNLSTQEKYVKLKEQFKIGKASINQFDVRFSKNASVWNGALKDTFVLANDPNAQLEIIEVQEVPQQKLIPEMHNKAFWVTFKIKADFGNGNNIDGTLKVRYLIY